MRPVLMTENLQSILQRRAGADFENARMDDYQKQLRQCPPIDPNLIGHLKKMFSNKKAIHPTNPTLAQQLMVQYGCDLIIEYLEERWNQQTLKVRREREI